VRHLEYEAFEALAVREGEPSRRAIARLGWRTPRAAPRRRSGDRELAVWWDERPHRHEAFLACRYIIDEVKQRVPIWKKEHYVSGIRLGELRTLRRSPAHAHPHLHD